MSQNILPGLDLVNNKKGKTEIPFKYIAGYMLLEVKVEGILPLIFIFDTGAEHTIIFEKQITDLIGFKYDKKVNLRGSDVNSTVSAFISRNIDLQIESTVKVKRDVVVLEENFLNLKELTGTQIDGIIGGSYFRNLIIEINNRQNTIVIWHPEKFDKKLRGYTKAKLEVENQKPYMVCKTTKPNSEEYDLRLLIDTGASLSYLINTGPNKVLTAPENVMPGNLGKGISGFISGYKGKMQSLQFGEYHFKNILTHFQEIDETIDPAFYNNRDGLIGNLLLERFNIVINYFESEIYLKPIRNLNRQIRYNLSGMDLIAFGPNLENFMVLDVIRSSPAQEAGIQKGDIIKRVGILSADRYSLFNLEAKLSRREGKKIAIEVLRGDELLKSRIILRDYLSL